MKPNTELPAEKEWGLHDYISFVLRRKWIILSLFVANFALSLVYLHTRPTKYLASSTFLIEDPGPQTTLTGTTPINEDEKRDITFYTMILQSQDYRQRLLEMTAGDSVLLDLGTDMQPSILEAINNLSIKETEFENFFRLETTALHPTVVYRVACLATDLFKQKSREIEIDKANHILNHLGDQIAKTKRNMGEAEKALLDFIRETKISSFDDLKDGTTARIQQISDELEQVQSEKKVLLSNLSIYEAQIQSPHQAAHQNDEQVSKEWHTLQAIIKRLEAFKKEIIEKEGADSPKLAVIESRIEQRKKELRTLSLNQPLSNEDASFLGKPDRIAEEIQQKIMSDRISLKVLEKKEKSLLNLLDTLRRRNENGHDKAIEFAQLQRKKNVNETIYNLLLAKAEEIKIAIASLNGGIRIIDEPVIPVLGQSQNNTRNLAVGFILSLGIGFGVAFLIEMLDTAIHTPNDLYYLKDISILGTIPVIKHYDRGIIARRVKASTKSQLEDLLNVQNRVNGFKNKIISIRHPNDYVVDSYKHIRTNLLFEHLKNGLDKIVVTSPMPKEGKTLTSANLGISMAEVGKRTLIVDCDMRLPQQHILFAMRQQPGLSDVLMQKNTLERSIYHTTIPNLFIMPAGLPVHHPAELIASNKMGGLIKRLEENFDFILFDTPPAAIVTDAVLLTRWLKKVILVVRYSKSKTSELDEAIARFRNVEAQLVGLVMNFSSERKKYSYYKNKYVFY